MNGTYLLAGNEIVREKGVGDGDKKELLSNLKTIMGMEWKRKITIKQEKTKRSTRWGWEREIETEGTKL